VVGTVSHHLKPATAIALLAIAAVVALATGCKPPAAPSAPAESPSPVTPTPLSATTTTPVERTSTGEVRAESRIELDPRAEETAQVKAEVLKRIDRMPNVSAENKDRLYVQVERARGMGRVLTIPFASGRTTVNTEEISPLRQQLALPQVAKLAEDPTVVFVVLGFADTKGDPKKNLDISTARADSVADALKDKCGVLNMIHPVGMGGSDLFDAQAREKNRVVEVWAVLP